MKKHKELGKFVARLKKVMSEIKCMKPNEVHVLSVNANHGHYQIIVGLNKKDPSSVEIDGEIHHLFVTHRAARLHPSKTQMLHNMRGSVVMRDLKIHIFDPLGDGCHVSSDSGNETVRAREYINFAGSEGTALISSISRCKWLAKAAYRIAQEDILEALKSKKNDRAKATA